MVSVGDGANMSFHFLRISIFAVFEQRGQSSPEVQAAFLSGGGDKSGQKKVGRHRVGDEGSRK